jgi:hypothetical protein
MEMEEFVASIILTPRDARKHKRILNKVRINLQSNLEHNAFYEKVLSSDQYSYDVKLKSIFSLYTLEQSRLWGFRNLSGEALFLFTQKVLQYARDYLSVGSLNALASNPAFAESVSSEFDVPKIVFESLVTEQPKKETMLNQIAASTTMNLGIAELIVNLNAVQHTLMPQEDWTLDDSAVIEWTRTTYDMGDVPDSWVRQFLMEAG